MQQLSLSPQAMEETLTIDLALLDNQELLSLPMAIARAHLHPVPTPDAWRAATHQSMIVFEELDVRQREHRSTHERIDARYVSDHALLEIYYAQRQEAAQVLPACVGDDPVALAAYRDRYNLLADESKSWLIYRILKRRGVQVDLYFPGIERQAMAECFKICPTREGR